MTRAAAGVAPPRRLACWRASHDDTESKFLVAKPRKSSLSLFDLPETADSSADVPPPPGGFVNAVALHEAAQSRYLNYALSVITSRALPDVRDGLKTRAAPDPLHDVAAEPDGRCQASQVREGGW